MRMTTADDGFTLIEAVIACAILATAVLSIGHMASNALRMLADARSTTFATVLAASKLEELRSLSAPAAGTDVVDDAGHMPSAASVRRYERRWSVVALSADAGVLNVVVAPVASGPAGGQVRMTGAWTRGWR